MPTLSRDQSRAVNAGFGPSFWAPINLLDFKLPPVADWIEDLHLDWHIGYSNGPSTKIWSTRRPFDELLHPGAPVWEYDSGFYVARLEDGRQFAYAAPEPRIETLTLGDESFETWVTPQQEGFGGRHIPITLRDGRRVILRGPWHANPSGCEAVTVVEPRQRETATKPLDWHTRGGCFGLFLPTLHLVAAIHRFEPDLKFACVTLDGIESVDPYRGEWEKPKAMMTAGERKTWGL